MGKRYYRKHKKNTSPLDYMLDGLFDLLYVIFVKIINLIVDLIYGVFVFIRDRFYKIRIEKKPPSSIQDEIQPIPEPHFGEREEKKEVYLPYRKKSFLLTRTEYNFDKVLREVVQDRYYIGRQVPLSSIVEVTSSYKPHRSKIDKKTIDFVLFNKAGYTPHLAIELDDPSHFRWNRIQRDKFVEDVLQKAGIKILRIKTSYSYNTDEIKRLIG